LKHGRSVLAAIGRDWSIDLIGRARSAYPLTIVTGTDALGIGSNTLARPDSVPGMPVWIDDSSVGGDAGSTAPSSSPRPRASRET